MNNRRKWLGAAALAAAMRPAFAQSPNFPSKPISLVGPFPAGASTDVISRIYAAKLSPLLGTAVIVDNKPGAGGMISVNAVARAPADGHTLLVVSNTFLIAPYVYRNPQYDALTGFLPVTGLFTTPIALSARPDFPAKSLAEFVALAKASPGKFSYSTWGIGTSAHLQMELLRMRAGIDVLHVPYKNGPEAGQAVMGGQTDVGFDTVFSLAPRLKAGQLRALTVFSPKRATVLPEVPTNGEQGFADIEQLGFCGLVAALNTPREVIDKLVQASAQVVRDADYGRRLRTYGADPFLVTPEQWGNFMREETAKIREVTARLKIALD